MRNTEMVDEPRSLSELIDDCLRDVFTRLDQDDLDEIAVLNRRMNALATEVRPRARKMEAEELKISDETMVEDGYPRVVTVNVITRDNLIEKVFDSVKIKSHEECQFCEDFAPVLHMAFLFAELALRRFSFKKVFAETNKSFCVMPSLFNRFLTLDHQDELEIVQGYANSRNFEPFWDWIIAGKPKTLTICSHYRSYMVDLKSLDKYSTAVHHPSINFVGLCGQINSAPNEERAPEIFGRFANMHLAVVNIDPHRLLKIVMARVRNRVKGVWQLNTSHYIDLSAINAAIDPTWKGELLMRGDLGMGNFTKQRYAIRDSAGKTIMMIDTNYELTNQPVEPRIYGEQVTIHFC